MHFCVSESVQSLLIFFCLFFVFSCLFWATYLTLHFCTFPSIWSDPNNLYNLNTGTSESSFSVLFGTYFSESKIMDLTDMSKKERLGILSTVDSSRAISTNIHFVR